VSRSSGANLARNAPGPRDIGDGSDLKRPYQILRVSPTKKRGTVFAHVIVQFGPAWVRYRVVKTSQGLRVFPPSNPCPGPGGKMFYKRSAGVDDVELRERLQDDILKALEAHLREDGRRLPKPVPKTPRRNRVREALLAVADEGRSPLSRASAGQQGKRGARRPRRHRSRDPRRREDPGTDTRHRLAKAVSGGEHC
jgi:hypothetical protein